MTNGIHGDTPISYQLDVAIARADELGRPIAHIKAAKPFIENLLAELRDRSILDADPGVAKYCGIVLETEYGAETGWQAYDAEGHPIAMNLLKP